jgi:phosphoglycolate phosphatase
VAVPVAVFDLDETLTDPKVGITRSVHYALVSLGVDVDDLEFLTAYIGPPLQDSFASIAGLSAHDTAKPVGKYREYFTETGIYENRVYPGIPECLGFLGVATRRGHVEADGVAERILAHFHLRSHFEAVVGSELDGFRRHKPHVITHALALLGVSTPAQAVSWSETGSTT